MRGKKTGRFNRYYKAEILSRVFTPAEMESFHAEYESAKMVNIGRVQVLKSMGHGKYLVQTR